MYTGAETASRALNENGDYVCGEDDQLTLVTSASWWPDSAEQATLVTAAMDGKPFRPTPRNGKADAQDGLSGDPSALALLVLSFEGLVAVAFGSTLLYRRWKHVSAYIITTPALLVWPRSPLRRFGGCCQRGPERSRRLTAKQGAFLAAAALIALFFPTSTVDTIVVNVDGRAAEQPELSLQVLADAGNPLALSAGLPSFTDVPMSRMRAEVPVDAMDAYHRAEAMMAGLAPDCRVSWSLLAAIEHVDSGGSAAFPIIGPVLDRNGFAAVPDTDGGVLDGNAAWDRAVGPMQFIPASWQKWASDGTDDGVRSPHDVYDAALAAGRYLCAGGGDLQDPRQTAQAVFRYNHSDSYVATVLLWADAYASGAVTVPDMPYRYASFTLGPVAGSVALPGPTVFPPSVEPAPPPVTTAPPPTTTPPSPTTTPPSATMTPPPPTTPPVSTTTELPVSTTTTEPPITTTDPTASETTTTTTTA